MDNKKELIALMKRHIASIVVANESEGCVVDCIGKDAFLVYYSDANGNNKEETFTNIDDVLNFKIGKGITIGEMVENGADCWED